MQESVLRKIKKTFSKVISWTLAAAMLIGSTPANFALVTKAATDATNITVHFQNEHGWGTPAIQWWEPDDVTASHGGVTVSANDLQEIPGWGDAKGAVLKDDGAGFYSITLTGNIGGFQFLDMDTPSNNTAGKGYDELAMPQFNDSDTAKDLYAIWIDDQGTKDAIKWYLDSEGTEELTAPAGGATSTDLTVHFKNEKNWDTVYAKFAAGSSWSSIADYEYCNSAFGGILSENTKNSGWYTYRVTNDNPLASINGLFNGGVWSDETQTGNYSIAITANVMEAWITYSGEDNKVSVSHEAPSDWDSEFTASAPINPADLSDISSPVINDDGSVTFNYEISKETLGENKVYLMGDGYFTDWSTGVEMTDEDDDGVYSVTIPDVKPGSYQYKFRYGNNWVTDPLNSKQAGGNSLLVVEGFLINTENPAGTGSFDVSATVGDTVSANSIDWSVTDEAGEPLTGITVEGDSSDLTKATLITTDDAKTGYFLLQADYEDDGKEKNASVKLYYTSRAFLYEYEYKDDSANKGKSDIYTWYNSKAGNTGAKFKEVNGKNTAYITLDDAAKNFGYIIRILGEWGEDASTDREFGDRTLSAYEGERYTKVKGGEGIEEPYILPSGKTYYNNGIVFAWRDDAKFYENDMDSLSGAAVNVCIKKVKDSDGNSVSGSEITKTMTYSSDDELFTYYFNQSEGLEEGTYEFYFTVDGESAEDLYFNGMIEYKKPVLDIEATVTPDEADYDDNPVISFEITDQGTGADMEVSAITAELDELGYVESTVSFNPLNKEGVVYIDRSVEAGEYNVPVTVTDLWGNETPTSVKVKVANKADSDAAWDESRIYFLLTDRFMDGDTTNNANINKEKIEAYHGGDFAGLTNKLGYLQELGINTIWITPIVDNIDHIKNVELGQQGYHGYWAKDFTKLDEHLGDISDLDKLLDEAHKRGIKIMVDIVVNHAGYDTENQPDFAGMLRTEADTVEGDVILDALDNLPDFKTEDPEVRAKLVAWQTAWVNHTTASGNRIDYFRVDTVKHVDHETWQDLKTAASKSNPDFKMIGEYFGASISNTGDYLGNGQMDALLDFDFKEVARKFINGDIDAVEAGLESRNSKLSNSLTMGQFLSSHDEDGFLHSIGNDTAKMKAAAALQITAKGMPIIYYGEEIGLTGPNEFGNQNNNRYDMKFTNLSDDQKAMLTHYKKLLAARAMYSDVFATGTRTKVAGGDSDGYLVFERASADKVYVAINTTDSAKEATFSVSIGNTVSGNDVSGNDVSTTSVIDLYSGETIPVVDGEVTVTIPASSNGGTVILANGKELTNVEFLGPNKTSYKFGEELDLDGLSVTAVYSDVKVPVSSGAYSIDASAFNKNKEGTYTIKVSYKGYTKDYQVSVAKKEEAPNPQEPQTPQVVKVSKISFDKSAYYIGKGKSMTLTASVAPSNAANQKLTWSSSSKDVTVDTNGKITGKTLGKTAIITAAAQDGSGVKATCKVTVGYKVTYKLNGGKNHASNPSAFYNQKISLKAPTRKGYTFSGWYTDKKFKKKITSISKSTKKDVTVYAKWAKVTKPAKAVIKSAKAGSKRMTVTLGKKAAGVKGYEIAYGTNKKITKDKKTVTTTSTKKVIKSLKKGTTYYVKARAYKLDSAGNKVYGGYSKVQTVKVK